MYVRPNLLEGKKEDEVSSDAISFIRKWSDYFLNKWHSELDIGRSDESFIKCQMIKKHLAVLSLGHQSEEWHFEERWAGIGSHLISGFFVLPLSLFHFCLVMLFISQLSTVFQCHFAGITQIKTNLLSTVDLTGKIYNITLITITISKNLKAK